jgi:hypothetical protein
MFEKMDQLVQLMQVQICDAAKSTIRKALHQGYNKLYTVGETHLL